MNAPDKLFLHPNYKGDIGASWLKFPITNEDVTYIRKDIADAMVESAEDHAYFAGQEKLREKLLEWAKERQAFYRKRADNIEDDSNPDVDYFYGKEYAFKEVIDKIESL